MMSGSLVMAVSVGKEFADGLLAIMQAGFDGAGGDAEDRGDVVDGEFFEEVQGQCLALGKGEAIERVMDLLGVVKGEEGAVGRRGFLGFRLGIILVRSEAQAGDG